MTLSRNQQWTRQQQKGNWLINLLFGCKQQREAYLLHLQHLEAVIQDLTKSNNGLKVEFDTLKIDYQKLREENFTINIAIAQKENQIEEMSEAIETKHITFNQNQGQEVVKPKRRVKY
jgi:allophanate hydrolase subunit 1